ncbi:MAG: DNA polymerase I [Chloroflexi bacterium]|nr:DNA polymerase I [Chloroflexota bacterium]
MSPKAPSTSSGQARSDNEKPKLVIFDGHGIIYRAFYAFKDPLTVRKTGEIVTVPFGFANTLLTVLDELKPTHVAVALDPPGKTFRHEKDATYKATRRETPKELTAQLGRVREVIEAFNIPIYMADGYEADDVLGTLARQADEAGAETYLVTLDSDIVQLIGNSVRVFMIRPFKHDTVTYDAESATERYGVTPQQIPDLKGLKGDSSDNIAGVPGIGDKTALKLITEFGSIENLYDNIEDVMPEKLRENLRAHEDEARHSKDMVVIRRDAPVELDLEGAVVQEYDRERLEKLFVELEFKSLIPRLPEQAGGNGKKPAAESKPPVDQEYSTIYAAKDLTALIKKLKSAKAFTFGVMTTSASAFQTSLAGLTFSWAPGKAAYVPVSHQRALGDPDLLSIDAVVEKLGPLLADAKVKKSAHNAKFAMEVLSRRGIEVEGVVSDTALGAYLLGDRSTDIDWLATERLGVDIAPMSDLVGKGVKKVSVTEVSAEQASPFACADVDMSGRLKTEIEPELKEEGLADLYNDIEIPLISVLMRMEQAGVAIDSDALREMSIDLGEQVEKLAREAYDSVGHEFNLGSPQQLSKLFFEELGLPKTRRTKQGYTTDATALEGLRGAHAVIDVLLEWRQLTKLKSTYIDALPALVHPDTGRIHSNFNQMVAATGRLSSQDPNLQNIPVRTDLGNAIRRAFVARDFGPKPVLLAADYSQIELRILAHLSGDPRLLEAFQNDEDIHAATASQVFGTPIDKVTEEERRRAKVFNFGVLYGLSEFGLSAREGISREESREFIENYFEKYPKVKEWREGIISSCRELGYAETMVGRKRRIPEIRSSNFQARAAAERIAVNMPAQGTASDIIKIAMNKIDAEMREREMTTRMILQVHDELIFEGPTKERDDVQEMVLRIMPQSLELAVPLKVDVKVGKSWGDMKVVKV